MDKKVLQPVKDISERQKLKACINLTGKIQSAVFAPYIYSVFIYKIGVTFEQWADFRAQLGHSFVRNSTK
jgi:hypothetical protein